MKNIILFDQYIFGELSADEEKDFISRLKNDSELAGEFQTYISVVKGVCLEAQQDDIEFGVAMKNISKEELREIMGPRLRTSPHIALDRAQKATSFEMAPAEMAINFSDRDDVPAEIAGASTAAEDTHKYLASKSVSSPAEKTSPKKTGLKSWIWQAASIAAVVVIALTVVLNFEKRSRESVDNIIFNFYSNDIAMISRGGEESVESPNGETTAIEAYSSDPAKAIPALRKAFDSADDPQEIAISGQLLALAYIKDHQRKEAKEVLETLINRLTPYSPDWDDTISECQTILDAIK